MPALLAVRAFLGKHAELKHFDVETEHALIEAERTGDFQELREAIAAGLWSATCAEHFRDVLDLAPAERGRVLRGRMEEWLFTYRPVTPLEFRQAEYARGLEAKPETAGPMRGFLMPAEDERPKPYRWEFAAEAPPGFPQGGEGEDPPDDAVPAKA